MAIILHCCASRWKYSDLSLNNSAQINRFFPKHCWFSILAHNFNQNYSQNANFFVSQAYRTVFFLLIITCCKFAPKSTHHQIARFLFQKYKIFQLLRGAHPPSDIPLCTTQNRQVEQKTGGRGRGREWATLAMTRGTSFVLVT